MSRTKRYNGTVLRLAQIWRSLGFDFGVFGPACRNRLTRRGIVSNRSLAMSDATIPSAILELFETDGLAGLGPHRRASAHSEPEVRSRTKAAMDASETPRSSRDLILSAALLWHDHLDASHCVSQDITSVSGSFLHGIMHRREPDYPNGKYWFHRTGDHPVFPVIAERVADLLGGAGDSELADRLVSGGNWNADGMVDACADAERGRLSPDEVRLIQQVQQIEIQTLVEAFCQGDV
jgi:hypothetical protein